MDVKKGWREMFLNYEIKEIIEKLLSYVGIGIYRLNPSPEGANFTSTMHHNSKERLNELFSDTKIVKKYLKPARFRFYNNVVDLLFENGIDANGKHIADVGCGTGHLLQLVCSKFEPLSITGFEYSESAIDVAKMVLPEAKFQYFDIYEGTDLKFDIIFCTEVLEHLLYPDKALNNLVNLMNPSSVVVITVPNGRVDRFEGHINFWSPESWKIFINSIGEDFFVETGLTGNGSLVGENKVNYAIIRFIGNR